MKFIVDANVLSEPTKPAPDGRILAWLRAHEAELVVNPIVLGEIEYGIMLLPASKRRTRLLDWFTQGVQRVRSVDIDARTATAWAGLLARLKKKGVAMPVKDSLIAASALAHGLSVATRNTADYRYAAVSLVNPFE